MREAVKGFRCQYDEADGTRVDRVYQTTKKAINRMRRKAGPWFLRFPYYRYLEHVGIHEDFKAGYRKKPSAKFLKEKDPVLNAEKFAVQKGITQSEIKRINEKVKQQIDISVEKAKLAPYPEPEVLTHHVIS